MVRKYETTSLRYAVSSLMSLVSSQVTRFQLESPKMIQTLEDALFTLTVGETEEDILNEVSATVSPP